MLVDIRLKSLLYLCLSIFLFAQVVLAANDLPSINDVTYPELIEIVSKVMEGKTF